MKNKYLLIYASLLTAVVLMGATSVSYLTLNSSSISAQLVKLTNVANIFYAAGFWGSLYGNVTGDVSGNAGTVTNGVYTGDVDTASVANKIAKRDVNACITVEAMYGKTAKLTDLTDDYIPYHVSDSAGLANGPTKTNVDSAISLKHAAVTVNAPIWLDTATQVVSFYNDANNRVTEVDTGALANSDTVIPTSKAVTTATATFAQGTLATNAMPKDGGTFTGSVFFTDNFYDIGASGATRPRTGYFGNSIIVPTIAGSVTTANNLSIRANTADLTGQVNITSTLEASSTSTASLTTAGGLGVAKRLWTTDLTSTNAATLGTSSVGAGIELNGLGTGNRYAVLDLVGDDTYTDYGFRILRANTGANADSAINHKGTGDLVITTEEAGDIVFSTTNAERVRILANGNVGIGTTSPGHKLDILTDANSGVGVHIYGDQNKERFAIESGTPVFQGGQYAGTYAAKTATQSGSALAHFQCGGYDGTNQGYNQARMIGFATENHTTTAHGTSLQFQTTANTTTTTATRMTIDNNGRVGIATTTPDVTLDIHGQLMVTDPVTIFTSAGGGGALNLDVNVGGVGYYLVVETSSQRYKDDIKPSGIDSSKILQLNSKSFVAKADGIIKLGFIAEEIAEVCPEIVNYRKKCDVMGTHDKKDKDGKVILDADKKAVQEPNETSEELIPDSFNWKYVTVFLVEENKRQQKLIDDLISRIEKLEKSKESK